MAQVPQNNGPQVLPQGGQPSQQIQASPENFGAGIGRGLQSVGAAGEQFGDVLAQHAVAMAQLQSNADADAKAVDNVNQLSSYMDKARTTLVGSKATPDALKSAQDDMEQIRVDNGADLSPYARRLYDQQTRRDLSGFVRSLGTHISTEQNKFIHTSALNAINSAQGIFALDPTEANLQNLKDTSLKQTGILASLDGEEPGKLHRDTMSASVAEAIKTQAIKDPVAAQAYWDAHKDLVTRPQDIQALTAALHQQLTPYNGHVAAKFVWDNYDTQAKATGIPPTVGVYKPATEALVTTTASKYHIDPAVALRLGVVENGGNETPKPNGSSTGFYQLQSGAVKDAGGGDVHDLAQNIDMGLKNFALKGQDLSGRLGRAISPGENYLAFQQGAAGAEALIKAPPGQSAVDALAPFYKDKATAQAAIAGNGGKANMSAADFAQMWKTKFEGTQSAGDQLEHLEASHQGIIEATQQYVRQNFAGDFATEDRAVQDAEREYNLRRQGLIDRTTASKQGLAAIVASDPGSGHFGPGSMSELLAIPGAADMVKDLTGVQKKTLEGWLASNRTAQFRYAHPSMTHLMETQPEVEASYRQIQGESYSDPGKFAARDLWSDPLTKDWPVTEVNKFQQIQDKIRQGKWVNPTVEAARKWAAPQLKAAGIDAGTDPDRYNKFIGAIADNAKTYSDENGKAPDQETVRNWTSQLLIEKSKGWLQPSKFQFEDGGGEAIPGVPNAAANDLIAYGRSKGRHYSPAEIQSIYAKAKGTK